MMMAPLFVQLMLDTFLANLCHNTLVTSEKCKMILIYLAIFRSYFSLSSENIMSGNRPYRQKSASLACRHNISNARLGIIDCSGGGKWGRAAMAPSEKLGRGG